MKDDLLDRLEGHPTARRRLHRDADFRVGVAGSGSKIVRGPLREQLTFVASDASGGSFAQWRRPRGRGAPAVVYVGSEGEVGRFARSFEETVQIVAALPGLWLDVWRGETLAEMRDEVLFARLELREEANEGDARARSASRLAADLKRWFDLPLLRDPAKALHRARKARPRFVLDQRST
jgi:hypothetical protein